MNYTFTTGRAARIINTIRANGGISFNPFSGAINPEEGYMVSLPGFERKAERITQEVLEGYINNPRIYDLLSPHNKGTFVGVWLHDGAYYIDVSQNIRDVELALRTAARRAQIAIWDCEKGREILVPAAYKHAESPVN